MEDCLNHNDYYIVFLNPKNRKTWNALKLLLNIAEANYVVYLNEEVTTVELYQVSKDEYRDYYYNPN